MTIIWCKVPEIWCVTDNFFHFGPFFCPFTLLKARKIKRKKDKMKETPGDIIILHKCIKNHDHMPYFSWDMARDRCNCYFPFWTIVCSFIPLTAQKIKTLKEWKKNLEISSFYICVPKIMIRWCTVPGMWYAKDGRTDRPMDRKSDT